MNFVEDLFEVNKAWQVEETLTGCLLSTVDLLCLWHSSIALRRLLRVTWLDNLDKWEPKLYPLCHSFTTACTRTNYSCHVKMLQSGSYTSLSLDLVDIL